MHLLNVSKEDWAKATAFFMTNPTARKMGKAIANTAYKFFKFSKGIVAVGKLLGKGAMGVVKEAETQTGENFAIKREGGPLNKEDLEEFAIGQEMDFAIDIMERKLENAKTFYPGKTYEFTSDSKKYKLSKLLEGNDLVFEIYDKKAYHEQDLAVSLNKLTMVQKLIIATQCCLLLKQLQAFRIIHADLKPENMKVTLQGNKIKVTLMDYGFSMHLNPGETTRIDVAKGTPLYMAKEVYKGNFSFESDIYATGVMFKTDLNLPAALYQNMIKLDPKSRENVDETIKKLIMALEARGDLDDDAKQFIQSVKGNPPALGQVAQTSQATQIPSKVAKIGYATPELIKGATLRRAPVTPKPKAEQVAAAVNPAKGVTLRKVAAKEALPKTPSPAADVPTQAMLKPVKVQPQPGKQNPPVALSPSPATAPQQGKVGQQKMPVNKQPQRKLPPPPPAQNNNEKAAKGAAVQPSMRTRQVFLPDGKTPANENMRTARLLAAYENQLALNAQHKAYKPQGAAPTPLRIMAGLNK